MAAGEQHTRTLSARWRWTRWLLCVLATAGVFLTASAAEPEQARAGCPGWMKEAAGWSGSGTGLAACKALDSADMPSVGELWSMMLEAVVVSFGGGATFGAEITWLTAVPNFTSGEASLTDGNVAGGNLAGLQRLTTAIALALLAAVVTLSLLGHFAAGFAGGRSNMLQGIAQSAGAGLFILAWPWIFENGVALSNIASKVVLANAFEDFQAFFDEAAGWATSSRAGLHLIFALLLSVPLALLGLALALVKVGLNAGTALVFVAMPITVALWPVPGFAWLTQWALRVYMALMLIPVGWALLAGIVVALGYHQAGLTEEIGDTWNALAAPLLMIALGVLMLKLPGMMLRAAGVTSGGGGFMSSFAAFTASHLAFRAIARAVPDALGGSRDTLAQRNALRQQAGAGAAQAQGGSQPRSQSPNASVHTERPAAGAAADLPGHTDQARHRQAVASAQRAQAGNVRGAPVRESDVTAALDVLQARAPEHLGATRAQLLTQGGPRTQGQITTNLANAAGADLPADVQGAFRTLAQAHPNVRHAAASMWEPHGASEFLRQDLPAESPTGGQVSVGTPTAGSGPAPPAPHPADLVEPASTPPGASPSSTNGAGGSGT